MGKRHIPPSSNLANYLVQRSRVGGFVTTAIVSFAILHFLIQGDPRYFSRSFNPVFNPMWRSGISNGLAIPYAVCIHVRTALTALATSLSEQSFSTAWASLVEACSLLSRSVLVDWRALFQHLVPRSQMDPFVDSGRALSISIRYEPNNTGLVRGSILGCVHPDKLASVLTSRALISIFSFAG